MQKLWRLWALEMTAEDWWVSLTNCKIHHAGVRAWNCPPEPHKPWIWKYCVTVHAAGKGGLKSCLVLLLFLPPAAWISDASMAPVHGLQRSGCDGWGLLPQAADGAEREQPRGDLGGDVWCGTSRVLSLFSSPAIKYCWCPHPCWWNEAWSLTGVFSQVPKCCFSRF